jgi:hypothetical protein
MAIDKKINYIEDESRIILKTPNLDDQKKLKPRKQACIQQQIGIHYQAEED